MEEDYIKEPKHQVIRFGPEVVEYIRRENNLDKKEDREKAITIIDDWVKSQDHFIKKDYTKGYIERCIITCNGSLEKTKKQIDRMCTMRTLLPHFFQITSLKDNDVKELFSKGITAFLPRLTKECYRVFVIKAKPNIILNSSDLSMLFKCCIYAAEYIKSHDFCLGFHVIFDMFDIHLSDVISNVNLIELQQFVPVFTKGYGLKIKGVYLVAASKLIEKPLNFLKPLLSGKILGRIHVVPDRKLLKNFIDGDVLASDYGGPEKSIQELQDYAIEHFSAENVQEFVKEMKKGVVDESKRRTDEFNNEYMGIPGTFRTLSLD